MEIIWNFILNNWDSIIVVIIALSAIIYLLYKGKKEIVFNMIKSLVTEAEKTFGNGTGQFKLSWVIEKIYPMLPTIIRSFVTVNKLTEWIEIVLINAKEDWIKNKNIQEYINK